MAKTDVAALLAIAAALMTGIGDVLEQRSAQQVTDKPVGTFALFGRLLRDRRWWAGSVVAGAGFGLQAAALGLGSVVLVQALSVTSLLFALLISAKVNHRRITRRQGIWAVLLAAAVAVVVTVGNPQDGNPRGSPQSLGHRSRSHGPGADPVPDWCSYLLGFGQGTVAGADVRFAVGPVLGVDQGRGRPARPWHSGITAHARGVRVGGAGDRRHSLGAVGVSGRPADRVAARGEGFRAHRWSVLGIAVLGETLNTNTVGWVAVGVSVAVMAAATVALAHSQATATARNGLTLDARNVKTLCIRDRRSEECSKGT